MGPGPTHSPEYLVNSGNNLYNLLQKLTHMRYFAGFCKDFVAPKFLRSLVLTSMVPATAKPDKIPIVALKLRERLAFCAVMIVWFLNNAINQVCCR